VEACGCYLQLVLFSIMNGKLDDAEMVREKGYELSLRYNLKDGIIQSIGFLGFIKAKKNFRGFIHPYTRGKEIPSGKRMLLSSYLRAYRGNISAY